MVEKDIYSGNVKKTRLFQLINSENSYREEEVNKKTMVHNIDYKKRKAANLYNLDNKNEMYREMINSPHDEKAKEIFRRPAFSIGKKKEN